MLDMMRRNSGSAVIYFIFAAIIAVFVINFNPGGGSCIPGRVNYAAVVEGETVPQQAFASQYTRQVEMYRKNAQQSGITFDAEMIERLGLRQNIIDSLIDRKLLAQQARRRGLKVSDSELQEFMRTRYGVKDVTQDQYREWVWRTFDTSMNRFEDDVRDDILGAKVERLIGDTVGVSDAELWSDYLREHDRAMVTFIKFDPAALKGPEPKAKEVDALLATDFATVEKTYNDDIMKYRTPQMVRARQIVKKVKPNASDAEVAKARGALLVLKEQIDGGADFAALAKQNSEDPAGVANGGDLGLFSRGQRIKAIEDAAFILKKDELTAEPVRSPLGLHLIQVTEIQPPSKKPLEDVKREVAAGLLHERVTEGTAKAQAEQMLAALRAGKKIETLTIDEAAARDNKSQRPVRADTAWILSSQDAIPRIGASPELHAEIFALSKEHSVAKQPHKVGRAYYVVVLKDRETPDRAKFEADKTSLRHTAAWTKRSRVFREWLSYLRRTAHIEYNPQIFPPKEERS